MSRAGSPETREALRQTEISRYYVWWLHIALLLVSWVAMIGLSISQLEEMELWHLSFFAFGLMLSYFTEYFGHRFPFHHKWGGPFFHRHTVVHHNFFSLDKGLNTESNEINFPDGYTSEERNYELLIDGSRKRRRGCAQETGGAAFATGQIQNSFLNHYCCLSKF